MASVNINGTLYPSVTAEPTHDAAYGKGGYRAVGLFADLGLIPVNYLSNGTVVKVLATNLTYQWNGSAWVSYTLQGINIADGSITSAKYGNASILTNALGANVVLNGNLGSDAVATINIQDGAVTEDKIDPILLSSYYTKDEITASYLNQDQLSDTYTPRARNGLADIDNVPSSSSDNGRAGTLAYDDTYLYICVSGDGDAPPYKWERIAFDVTPW